MRSLLRWIRDWLVVERPQFVSREKLYDLNFKAVRNVIYDRKGNAWRFRDALALLLVFASVAGAEDFRAGRPGLYRAWVKHYQNYLGLHEFTLVFEDAQPEALQGKCAWVRRGPTLSGGYFSPAKIVYVGLSQDVEKCRHWTPQWLALHEMCHLRMMHLWMSMPEEEMEGEVGKCVSWYQDRERRER